MHSMKTIWQFNDPPELMVSEKQVAIITESLLKLASNKVIQSELTDIMQYMTSFLKARDKGDIHSQEYALLQLYSKLHSAGSIYSPSEIELFRKRNAYSCHPSGLLPLIMAQHFINPNTISADLGAGNGLQGLLLQCLYPHQRTLQIEFSSELIRVGKIYQKVLGVSDERIKWIHDDIVNVSLEGVDFIYMYLPAKPFDGGLEVYNAIVNKLCTRDKPFVIFSIYDCLGKFLNNQFSIFYSDGYLTCFVKK